jgi:hypothetical protein
LKEFSEAYDYIDGVKHDYTPICKNWTLGEKIVELTPAEVSRLSENAISWALSQNLEEGLTEYRNLPTNSKGAMPARHLAALAIAGDIERLEYYKRCFDQGDRLGFAYALHESQVNYPAQISAVKSIGFIFQGSKAS